MGAYDESRNDASWQNIAMVVKSQSGDRGWLLRQCSGHPPFHLVKAQPSNASSHSFSTPSQNPSQPSESLKPLPHLHYSLWPSFIYGFILRVIYYKALFYEIKHANAQLCNA